MARKRNQGYMNCTIYDGYGSKVYDIHQTEVDKGIAGAIKCAADKLDIKIGHIFTEGVKLDAIEMIQGKKNGQ